MSFQSNPDMPIEFWLSEVAEVIKIREGIQRREAHLRILECMSYYIAYYEIGLRPESAVERLWKE